MGKRILLSLLFGLLLWSGPVYGAFPTPTDITTSGSTTDGVSYTTASITPPSDTLILAVVHSEISAGTPNIPTLAGNSLTWDQIGTDVQGANRTTVFRARGTATTGTVVISYAGQTISDCTWSIISVDGAAATGTNGSGAIVQSITNKNSGATSLTVTLGTFANAGNATFGGFGINNNVTMTAGSGFTLINQPGCCSSRAAFEWKSTNDTTVDMTWTTSTAVGVAFEVAPFVATGGRSEPLFLD